MLFIETQVLVYQLFIYLSNVFFDRNKNARRVLLVSDSPWRRSAPEEAAFDGLVAEICSVAFIEQSPAR